MNEADSEAAGLAVDALMNYETIKTFGSEDRIVGRYAEAMGDYARAAVKSNTSLQLLNAIQSVVLSLGLRASSSSWPAGRWSTSQMTPGAHHRLHPDHRRPSMRRWQPRRATTG